MRDRFEGESGTRLRMQGILAQKLVGGNTELAAAIDENSELRIFQPGEALIEQNGVENDVFLILAGSVDVMVNGRIVGHRSANDHVGEMAAIEPAQPRSASIVAKDETVTLVLSEPTLAKYGSQYPEIYRCIAKELARRLMQRNAHINSTHDEIRVFVISSVEALEVARSVQNALAHDPFVVKIWTDDVFRVSNYTIESLEDEIDISDFAIAIAHSDDVTESRGKNWPAPRDNVVFELGVFMGRLGRSRAILMEPRDEGVKLPSDLTGITTIPYIFEDGGDNAALMGPACNQLRDHIARLGPNN